MTDRMTDLITEEMTVPSEPGIDIYVATSGRPI